MLILYNLSLRMYHTLIQLAALFNKKAQLWLSGRRHQVIQPHPGCLWFHFASLGEFEQGRPILEALKTARPAAPVVITFFSPSGFEVRKNTPLANAVYYLPLDTAENARRFVQTLRPAMAIFTKYEYWYYYFTALKEADVPLYIISGIFRPGQVFFKWYGGLHRRMLALVSYFFVQDDASQQLLLGLGHRNVIVSGDTRFDRVWANVRQPQPRPIISQFKGQAHLFIAGSTWPADEKLLAEVVKRYPQWKFIFAPHEITKNGVLNLMRLLPPDKTARYSQISDPRYQLSDLSILIIDNVGMLSSLYQYGDVAYIGGGFGGGIHNLQEAAAFGLPVIFGPKYKKFKEACDFVEQKTGLSITSLKELLQAASLLMNDAEYRNFAGSKIKNYVAAHTGATTTIVNYIAGEK